MFCFVPYFCCTAYVERTNLTSRQVHGHLVRKTLSYSKQPEMLQAACAWEDWVLGLDPPGQDVAGGDQRSGAAVAIPITGHGECSSRTNPGISLYSASCTAVLCTVIMSGSNTTNAGGTTGTWLRGESHGTDVDDTIWTALRRHWHAAVVRVRNREI